MKTVGGNMTALKVRMRAYEVTCPKCGKDVQFQPEAWSEHKETTGNIDKVQVRCGTCGWAILLSWEGITAEVEDIGYLCLGCGKKHPTDEGILINHLPYCHGLSCKECKKKRYLKWIEASEKELKQLNKHMKELELM